MTVGPVSLLSIGSNQYRDENKNHDYTSNEQRSEKPNTSVSVAKDQANNPHDS